MTKTEWKTKLFNDAQDVNADCSLDDAKEIIKNMVYNLNFTQEETILIAKEYSFLEKNKNALNLLDYELRILAIQGQNYFTGYGPVVPKIQTQKSEPKIPWILALLGGGVLIYAIARRK